MSKLLLLIFSACIYGAVSDDPKPGNYTGCYKMNRSTQCESGDLSYCDADISGKCGWARYRVEKKVNDYLKGIMYFGKSKTINVDLHFGQCSVRIRNSKPVAVNDITDFKYHHIYVNTGPSPRDVNFTFVPVEPAFGDKIYFVFNSSFVIFAYPGRSGIEEGFYFDCPIQPVVMHDDIGEFWLDVITWGIPDGRFAFLMEGLNVIDCYNGNYLVPAIGVAFVLLILMCTCRRRRRVKKSTTQADDKEPLVNSVHVPVENC